MSSDFVDAIVQRLLEDSFFCDYKFRKRDCVLRKSTELGCDIIELQFWKGFDLSRNQEALIVKPLYLKRFDVVHQWFEEFSFKSKQDQRDNYSIGFDGKMLGKKSEFCFLLNGKSFNSDFENLKKEIFSCANIVFSHFTAVEDLYEYYVDPIFNGKVKLPDVGADWIFEYLLITKLVNNDMFEPLLERLVLHARKMYEREEPNIMEYYPKFEEIVDHLRSLKIKH